MISLTDIYSFVPTKLVAMALVDESWRAMPKSVIFTCDNKYVGILTRLLLYLCFSIYAYIGWLNVPVELVLLLKVRQT